MGFSLKRTLKKVASVAVAPVKAAITMPKAQLNILRHPTNFKRLPMNVARISSYGQSSLLRPKIETIYGKGLIAGGVVGSGIVAAPLAGTAISQVTGGATIAVKEAAERAVEEAKRKALPALVARIYSPSPKTIKDIPYDVSQNNPDQSLFGKTYQTDSTMRPNATFGVRTAGDKFLSWLKSGKWS